MIAASAFGIQVDSQTNTKSEFMKYGLRIVDQFENAEGFLDKLHIASKLILSCELALHLPKFRSHVSDAMKSAHPYSGSAKICDQVAREKFYHPCIRL